MMNNELKIKRFVELIGVNDENIIKWGTNKGKAS
jgi:hypothetical protein